jgi:hypothetical protein
MTLLFTRLSLPAVELSGETAVLRSVKVIFKDCLFESLGHDGHSLAVGNPLQGMIDRSTLQYAHQALRKRQVVNVFFFTVWSLSSSSVRRVVLGDIGRVD